MIEAGKRYWPKGPVRGSIASLRAFWHDDDDEFVDLPLDKASNLELARQWRYRRPSQTRSD